jgi:hypothetical protein
MYSRNVPNLFLAGRIISASHIAFGSTRVMATCGHNGQAVGMAAALCKEDDLRPRDLIEPCRMRTLQQRLLRVGQHIPGIAATVDQVMPTDKARSAIITASSTLELGTLSANGEAILLDKAMAMLLPLTQGSVPLVTVFTTAEQQTSLRAELWIASRAGNTTPNLLLSSTEVKVAAGVAKSTTLDFHAALPRDAYAFVVLQSNPLISLALNHDYVCGVLTLSQKMNSAVAKNLIQNPPKGSGIDTFAFWLPDRRPVARNLACTFQPPIAAFSAANVVNGYARPWDATNAWVPALDDKAPMLHLVWDKQQTIQTIEITFDTDYDHPMESVLLGHPERIMPGCITAFDVRSAEGRLLAHVEDNHQTRFELQLEAPLDTCGISIAVLSHGPALPAIFEVRCY